ncbi:MAG: NADH-quinone oxidoreductase subunit H [Lentisphaeria bacterium]|nr:NADH-quinone oxidoreductase subunit H [Lentisphaeria bacterium]
MNNSLPVFAVNFIAALVLAPLLPGIINKVKAFFAGRKGPRLFQLYSDLGKLLKKECVISSTSGGILRIAPAIQLTLTVLAALLLPMGFKNSPLMFPGDVLLFFYLLGTCRFFSVLAALDTGSSFEGMGAAREAFFSALAEAAVFAVLAFLVLFSHSWTLSGMLTGIGMDSWISFTPVLLVSLAMLLVMLAENCRVPFDDPETHLELTMIHEAMILDYSGADLGAILYTSSLKLWIFGSFIVSMLIPGNILSGWQETALSIGGVFASAVLVGIVESSMARYRFLKVPPLLISALVLAIVAMIFQLFFNGGIR